MFTSKLSRMFTVPVALMASIAAQNAFSVTYQAKPDFPVDSGEFGHTLAKHGKYIVVGSDRHTEFGRSDPFSYLGHWTANRNIDGGAIYLLTDDNSEAIKKYQFLKEPALEPTIDHATYLATPLNFGSQVDITDNWIIATLPRHHTAASATSQPAVVIIPKTSGQFVTCPTAPYTTGQPGTPSTQRSWGSALNCTPISGTDPNSNIVIVPLPAEFNGYLGRAAKVKISGNAFVVAAPNRAVTYHRNASTGQWQLIQTFVPDSGQIISDIDLHGQHLAIGVNSDKGPISYQNSDGVLDYSDFIYDYSGKVYTFELSSTAATTAGVITGGGVGFGLQVALGPNLLLIGSGGIEYPTQYFTLHPSIANTPLPIGKVHRYKFDTQAASGQNAWLNRGYGEFTSTPRRISLDGNVAVVQLYEAGQTTLNTTYIPYQPNVVAHVYHGDVTQEVAFDLGSWAPRSLIYKSQLDSARPYYETNSYFALDPVQVSNGNVVFGWRAARGDSSSLFPLNGAIFQVNLSEL